MFLALSAVAAWLSARAISGDVHFVTRRVHAIAARGDLGEPVAIRALDEVGALTRAFEQLRRGYLDAADARAHCAPPGRRTPTATRASSSPP